MQRQPGSLRYHPVSFPSLYEILILAEASRRYNNLLMTILGSYAFYSHSYTPESCRRLYLLPTFFRGSLYVMAILRRP